VIKEEEKINMYKISQIDMTYFAPKSAEEYKEYLDNLLIEYQFACFSEKLGDGMFN
jgi:hypothetical protein